MSPPDPAWGDFAFTDDATRAAAVRDRVAVITGASRGLGWGIAQHFAGAGVRLALCARNKPQPDAEGAILCESVDVTDFAALGAFAESIVDRFGQIDLWINNAGVLDGIGPLADFDPDVAAQQFLVNVNGVMHGTMLMARHVRSRPGSGVLVNISSGAASKPYEGWAPYCASKAAVERLSEVVALEEAASGLSVYAVSPGIIDTDMQTRIRATDAADFPEVERFRQFKADNAFSSPEWVGEKLLALAFGGADDLPVCLRVPAEPNEGPRR